MECGTQCESSYKNSFHGNVVIVVEMLPVRSFMFKVSYVEHMFFETHNIYKLKLIKYVECGT